MLNGLVVLLGAKNQVLSPKSSQSCGWDSVGSFTLGLFRRYHRTQRCMSPTSPGEVRIVHPMKTQTKFERTNINSAHCQGGSNAHRGGGACHTEPMAGTKAEETAKGPVSHIGNYSLGYELRMEWLPKVGICRALCARLGEGTAFPGNVELLKNLMLFSVWKRMWRKVKGTRRKPSAGMLGDSEHLNVGCPVVGG